MLKIFGVHKQHSTSTAVINIPTSKFDRIISLVCKYGNRKDEKIGFSNSVFELENLRKRSTTR